MQNRTIRILGETEVAREPDYPSSCVEGGGVHPVRNPDPICLELIDNLQRFDSPGQQQSTTMRKEIYLLLFPCNHCA
jgi:hypothetical protein